MIPILLFSYNTKHIEKYINEYIRTQKIITSYIFHYYPEPNVIKIEQIRDIKSLLTRIDSNRKLIILHNFDTAKIESQNAFLKTLEEKNNQAQFIIIAGDITQVLPTIRSRCKCIKLKSSSSFETSAKQNRLRLFYQSLPRIMSKYNNIKKEQAIKLCDEFLWYFKELIYEDTSLPKIIIIKIIKETIRNRNFVFKNNLNPQIAIDHILISISRIKI